MSRCRNLFLPQQDDKLVRSIVVPALDDDDALVPALPFNGVNKPVLSSDSARPEACKITFEPLRFAQTRKWSPPRALNQVVESRVGIRCVVKPVQVVIPPLSSKVNPQVVGFVELSSS